MFFSAGGRIFEDLTKETGKSGGPDENPEDGRIRRHRQSWPHTAAHNEGLDRFAWKAPAVC